MRFINSMIGDNRDEEEGSFLSDLVIAMVVVECCMCVGLLLSAWWPL